MEGGPTASTLPLDALSRKHPVLSSFLDEVVPCLKQPREWVLFLLHTYANSASLPRSLSTFSSCSLVSVSNRLLSLPDANRQLIFLQSSPPSALLCLLCPCGLRWQNVCFCQSKSRLPQGGPGAEWSPGTACQVIRRPSQCMGCPHLAGR